MRRIDVAKTILDNEDYLLDDVCPFCYHLLQSAISDEGHYLYCPSEMCLNEVQYPIKEVK